MPHLPDAIIQVLAPFAPLFSGRVWLHAHVLLLGAMLTPGARTVTAALRAMGLARERHFTNYHRVLNRASWSARQGGRILLGVLITLLLPGRDGRLRSGRHPRTPRRTADQSERLLPGCGAFLEETSHPVFRPEMGVDDAVGAGALEPTGVGLALFDRPLSVRDQARPTTA
jgi:DDE superfamily endonuclease